MSLSGTAADHGIPVPLGLGELGDGFGRALRLSDGVVVHRHAGAADFRETEIVEVCVEQGASISSAPAIVTWVVSRAVSCVSEIEALSGRAS
ncbi:hypothetical protein ACWDZ8_27655 [Streptomyces sp. NPDC003233]